MLYNDDRALYDILAYVLSYFLCIWMQIIGHLDELYVVWEKNCIIFEWVIVIFIYHKSC